MRTGLLVGLAIARGYLGAHGAPCGLRHHGNIAHPIGRLGNVGASMRCHFQGRMKRMRGLGAHEMGIR